MTRTNHRARAFTLLELVVSVGIVALAAALVIRTTIKVRDRAGDVTCQGNMRQLLQALYSYNVDQNGSMPYGIYYVGSGPPTWAPPPGGNNAFISWASELSRYFGTALYAPQLRCPDAQQQAGPHPVSYVANMIVMPSPQAEIQMGAQPPNAAVKPPNLHLMLRDGTALIWDTSIRAGTGDNPGYLIGADLDAQRFWRGALTPQFRYLAPNDPFGAIPPGSLTHNRPVNLNVSSYVYHNIDPPDVPAPWPYQGNLRFRHDGQTRCNVAFSDGSVRQFTAVVRKDDTVQSHDARVRYFMIRWPPGVRPDPTLPSVEGPPLRLSEHGRQPPPFEAQQSPPA
jgi:prepilin-type processing-associated H-X9-DG protein